VNFRPGGARASFECWIGGGFLRFEICPCTWRASLCLRPGTRPRSACSVCLVSDAVCPPTPCLSEFRFSHATHRLFGRSDRFMFTCLLVPIQVPPLAP